MPQRRGTWLPINERFFVRIGCVVMAAEGSRASLWQQLSITQWHRTLHETQESSQTCDACQPSRFPTRPIAVRFPNFSRANLTFDAPSRSKWRDDLRVVPSLSREAASPGGSGKTSDSKIIYLGYAQLADRVFWVAVVSKSDSATPWLKFGSGEDADPPSNRCAAFYARAIVPHGPLLSRVAASPGVLPKSWTAG